MGFTKNLITGTKLFVLNIVAGFLTALISWIMIFILLLVGLIQSAFTPFLIMIYIALYLIIMFVVGGWSARNFFGWK